MKKSMYVCTACALLMFACKKNKKKEEPQPAAPVVITAFIPAAGLPGDTVTITGTGFAAAAGNNKVAIGDLAAEVTYASSTQLKAVVPPDAKSDKLHVTVVQQSAVTADTFFLAYPKAVFSMRGSDLSPTRYRAESLSEYGEAWEWSMDGKVISTEKSADWWVYRGGLHAYQLVVTRTHRNVVYRDTAKWENIQENDTRLLACFPLDGTLEDIVRHRNGNARSFQLCPDRHGRRDSAVSLNGINQYIELPNALFPMGESAFTVSLWVKLDDPDATNGIFGIQMGPVGAGIPLEMNLPGLYASGGMLSGRLSTGMGGYSTFGIAAGWHHVVITADMFIQEIYVDGESKGAHHAPFAANFPPMPFMQLGAVCNINRPGHWSFLKGAVDDVRIYSTRLPTHLIQALAAE